MAFSGTYELVSREIFTRKDRRCEWCGEGIQKGERCQYRAYVHEDEFSARHMHPECSRAYTTSMVEWWRVGEFFRGTAHRVRDNV